MIALAEFDTAEIENTGSSGRSFSQGEAGASEESGPLSLSQAAINRIKSRHNDEAAEFLFQLVACYGSIDFALVELGLDQKWLDRMKHDMRFVADLDYCKRAVSGKIEVMAKQSAIEGKNQRLLRDMLNEMKEKDNEIDGVKVIYDRTEYTPTGSE